jgi:hypothetical protein
MISAFLNGFFGVFVVLLVFFAFSVHPALFWGSLTGVIFIVFLGIWNGITGGKGIKNETVEDKDTYPHGEDLNDEDRHHH